MPATNDTPNRIRKIPMHRKIKYLINEEEWAHYMGCHYFKQMDEAGEDVWYADLLEFNKVVEASDLTLEEFLGRDWR